LQFKKKRSNYESLQGGKKKKSISTIAGERIKR